jgi:hypothetical protein
LIIYTPPAVQFVNAEANSAVEGFYLPFLPMQEINKHLSTVTFTKRHIGCMQIMRLPAILQKMQSS